MFIACEKRVTHASFISFVVKGSVLFNECFAVDFVLELY
jgi:hypothetical protein